jgi:hypothetical protein
MTDEDLLIRDVIDQLIREIDNAQKEHRPE